jgi:hypothetical protein
VPGDQFQALAHRSRPRLGHVPGPVRRVRRLDRIRHQDLRRLTDQLVPPVPEQPLGLRVQSCLQLITLPLRVNRLGQVFDRADIGKLLAVAKHRGGSDLRPAQFS